MEITIDEFSKKEWKKALVKNCFELAQWPPTATLPRERARNGDHFDGVISILRLNLCSEGDIGCKLNISEEQEMLLDSRNLALNEKNL